jgi:nucleoside-diphosphate-sugar epimerase
VFRNNTGATFTVLEAAARASTRTAVIASSVSALGMT